MYARIEENMVLFHLDNVMGKMIFFPVYIVIYKCLSK